MKLDYQKELVPVIYSENAVKILNERNFAPEMRCFKPHWHERMELLLILEGSMQLSVGTDNVTACEGSLVIIPPDRPHSAVALQNGVRYQPLVFEIPNFYNSTNISRRFLEPIFNQSADFLPTTENSAVIGLVRSILEEYSMDDESHILIVVGKIYELLGLLFRHCLRKTSEPVKHSDFEPVLDFIADNFAQDITTYMLCNRFGYDEAYFCRRFKELTGLTPMNYLQIYRLEQARTFLDRTDLKISEISAQCGFADQNYFSRCFKRRYNTTPTEYRHRK